MNPCRVVVSGLGITSSLGHTIAEVTQSLRAGVSRIVVSQERRSLSFRSPLTAQLPPFDAKYKLGRRSTKYLAEASLYAVITWMKTLDENRLPPEHFTGPEVGIITGNDSSCEPIPELMEILQKYKETHFLGSGMVIKTMNSTCSMNLGPLIQAQGINITLSAACASGAHAIGLGFHLIRSGLQQAIVAGGFQELHWLAMASFDALGAFSVEPDPAKASRPFDHKRDGLVPGGGGAIVILENLERAHKLGHPIYGEIVGYGFSSDGTHLTVPSGDGARRSICQALADARLTAHDIDYISAHATSTPVGDQVEAGVINAIFGAHGPPVSSLKGMTGHECWMAGASQVVYALAMIQGGFIAPNINFDAQEEAAPKINIAAQTILQKPRTILCNSFGFGGTNACLIVREFNE